MNNSDFENILATYSQKLDQASIMNLQAWALHIRTIEHVQAFRVETRLRSLAAFKKAAVGAGIVWSLLLGFLIYGNHFQNIFFSTSLSVLFLFSILAIVFYVRQIIFIKDINYGDSILSIQEKLLKLQLSTLTSFRLLWLQLPFYSTFYWSKEWMDHDPLFWIITFPVTILLTLLAFWLYRNIHFRNTDKKWFRVLMGKKEWASIIEAKTCLDEIDTFRGQ